MAGASLDRGTDCIPDYKLVALINDADVEVSIYKPKYLDWDAVAKIIAQVRPATLYVGMRHTWDSTATPVLINNTIFDLSFNSRPLYYSDIDEPVALVDGEFVPCWCLGANGESVILKHAIVRAGLNCDAFRFVHLPDNYAEVIDNRPVFKFEDKCWPASLRTWRTFDWEKAVTLISEHKPEFAAACFIHDYWINGSTMIFDDGRPVIEHPVREQPMLASARDLPGIVLSDFRFYECWKHPTPEDKYEMRWPRHLQRAFGTKPLTTGKPTRL